eukprot:TRINITY_DN16929_c1_g1_i1.p1 TRINITY_DN16929_c1_g1~~TRINITY_DN16929_c1_g1_i1.p1  ORF type:complete len:406 (+),score=61.69 TRINITY_DN16929_c1_g1_i1:38-1255(+)
MLQSSVGVKFVRKSGLIISPEKYSRVKPQYRRKTVKVVANKSYYDVLGVSQNAAKKDIKSAYRQKARKYHPDVNKSSDAVERFKEISEAYEVLQDDQKRQIYDTYGKEGLQGGMGGMSGFSDPFDIFESFFSGMGMGGFAGFDDETFSQQPEKGENEEYDLVINFMEAAFGCTKNIKCSRLVSCPQCEGSGTKAGTERICSSCNGQGRMQQRISTPLGELQQVTTCPVCLGQGKESQSCNKCSGDGRVRRSKNVDVQIPAGIDDGQRLRLAGEGSSGRRGGPPGDMFVKIRVTKHPKLERKGTNLHTEVEINYTEAILGGSVVVETIDGEVELRIPGGTQPGTTLKLGGKGIPKLGARNQRGDQLVHVRIKIPTQISQEERKLIQQLDGMSQVVAPKIKVGSRKR